MALVDVPREAWQVGPWNRWSYQHVDEVVATAVVPRGDGPVHALGEGPQEPVLAELADALVTDGFADGVAVLHRGRLVVERYANAMRPATLHLSQSVGKSVLGLVVGALAGRGALDPDDLVSDHVPEVARSGYAGARVRHLLDMTAAVGFIEDYATFWVYDVACGWHPPAPGAPAATILEFLAAVPPAGWEHGARFRYATPNTDLLGLVAERAAGAPLAEVLATELWRPLGAERDALLTVDPAGTGAIGGGFCASLRDYTRVAALVLEGGRGIVPATWVAGLGRGDPTAFAADARWAAEPGTEGYARQWWRREARTVARGIHGQLLAIDEPAGIAACVLSSHPDALAPALDARHRGFVAAAAKHVLGASPAA